MRRVGVAGQPAERAEADQQAAPHIGDAGSEQELAAALDGTYGRRADGVDGVVMADQQHALGGRPLRRDDDERAIGGLPHLGLEPIGARPLAEERGGSGEPSGVAGGGVDRAEGGQPLNEPGRWLHLRPRPPGRDPARAP